MVRFEVKVKDISLELMILIRSGVKIRNTSFKCEYLEKINALPGKILLPVYSRCLAANQYSFLRNTVLTAHETKFCIMNFFSK